MNDSYHWYSLCLFLYKIESRAAYEFKYTSICIQKWNFHLTTSFQGQANFSLKFSLSQKEKKKKKRNEKRDKKKETTDFKSLSWNIRKIVQDRINDVKCTKISKTIFETFSFGYCLY